MKRSARQSRKMAASCRPTDLGLLLGFGRGILAEAKCLLPEVLAGLEQPHRKHAVAGVRGRVDRKAWLKTAREHDGLVQPKDKRRQVSPAQDVRQI